MEEQQRDLRQLVMKRAADRTVAGSGMASPGPRGEPLIQQVLKTIINPNLPTEAGFIILKTNEAMLLPLAPSIYAVSGKVLVLAKV